MAPRWVRITFHGPHVGAGTTVDDRRRKENLVPRLIARSAKKLLGENAHSVGRRRSPGGCDLRCGWFICCGTQLTALMPRGFFSGLIYYLGEWRSGSKIEWIVVFIGATRRCGRKLQASDVHRGRYE